MGFGTFSYCSRDTRSQIPSGEQEMVWMGGARCMAQVAKLNPAVDKNRRDPNRHYAAYVCGWCILALSTRSQ